MCFHHFPFVTINAFNGFPLFSISFYKGRGYNNNALHFFQSLRFPQLILNGENIATNIFSSDWKSESFSLNFFTLLM